MTIGLLVQDTMTGSDDSFTVNGEECIITGTVLSVIANLVLGTNQDWTIISYYEYFVLTKEVESSLSPYSAAFDLTNSTFYDQPIIISESV